MFPFTDVPAHLVWVGDGGGTSALLYDYGMEAMRAEGCISISLGLGSSLLPLLSRLMPRGACDDDEGAL